MNRILLYICLFFLFVSTSFSSTLVWETVISSDNFIVLYDMVQATDSTIIAVGGKYPEDFETDTVNIVTEINLFTGDTLWFKSNLTSLSYSFANSVDKTLDGNFVVAGHAKVTGDDENFYLIKIDPQGNVLWSRDYGTATFERCNSVVTTSDGGFLLTGRHGTQINETFTDLVFYCVKTDSLGNLIATGDGYFGDFENNVWGRCGQEMDNGNFIVGGYDFNSMNYIFYELQIYANLLIPINTITFNSTTGYDWMWRFKKNIDDNFVFMNYKSINTFTNTGAIAFDTTGPDFPIYGSMNITEDDDYIFVGIPNDYNLFDNLDTITILEYNHEGDHVQFYYTDSLISYNSWKYYSVIKDTLDDSYITIAFTPHDVLYDKYSVRILKIYPYDDYQFLHSDFRATPTVGEFPLTTAFEPLIYDSTLSYQWDFGDGNSSNDPFPIHRYLGSGYFDVTLTVSNSVRSRSTTKTDYIRSSTLIADFSSNVQIGINPLQVDFIDETIGSPDNWLWYFGDGNISTDQNPSNVYSDTGSYSVRLKVCDIRSCDSIREIGYVHVVSELKPDLSSFIKGSEPARPGFNNDYLLRIYNLGSSSAAACTVMCSLDPNLTIQSSSLPYSLIDDTIIWEIPSININEKISILLSANLSTSVQSGDTLKSYLNVSTIDQEFEIENNTSYYFTEVVNSWDPNDKIVTPNENHKNNTITVEDYLDYTIFFENKPEATGEAVYVFIVDAIDSNLDWSTFEVTNISHPNIVTYDFDQFTGEFYCFFDSIMLPPNNIPPEGEGFISYSIKPKSNLEIGTEISNEAFIKFDFNPWITAPESGPIIKLIRELTCCKDATGNINDDVDDILDISDLLYFIDYFFASPRGNPPVCELEADVNGSTIIDISDLLYLVDYFFLQPAGPAPVDCP